MKCPRCALHHPPQHAECVACGARLREEEPPPSSKNKLFGLFSVKAENLPAPAVEEEKPRLRATARNFDRRSQTQSSVDQLSEEIETAKLEGEDLRAVEERHLHSDDGPFSPGSSDNERAEDARQLLLAQEQSREAERLQAQELLAVKRAEAEKLESRRLEAEKELEKQALEAGLIEARRLEASKQLEFEVAQAKRLNERNLAQEKELEEQRLEARRLQERKKKEAQELEEQRAEALKRLEEERLEAEKIIEQRLREASRLADERRQAEEALAAQRQEQEQLAAKKVEAERLLAAQRQQSERLASKQQKLQEISKQLMTKQLEEQLARERQESEQRRLQLESSRQLELSMQPLVQAVIAASSDSDSFDESRHQEPHKPYRPRDPLGEGAPEKGRGYDARELQKLERSARGGGGTRLPDDDADDDDGEDHDDSRPRTHKTVRRSKALPQKKSGLTLLLGAIGFTIVLLVFAGATIFFLTKPPDDQRLYTEGLEQVKKGQYAFALKSLTDASALRPKDARIYLALARAYVGVDQVDKAWTCVSQAQQLGAGVAEEPELASDLAKYYRQKGEFEKAINLLRPLAKAEAEGKTNLSGKKAELADLDAMWGDDALRDGKLELSLRCWEEVRDLNDGSRASEAQSRLATIYQKLANTLASDSDSKNDSDALKYLSKLNNIAENPKNLELAADLYERSGQLELAIDQLRKAEKMDRNPVLQRRLAALLTRRGKELLDQGDSDSGYAYLQQAKSVSPSTALPAVALKEVVVSFDQPTASPKISGRVWNPTDKSVNSLNVKVELFDTASSSVLWSKEHKIVDDFVPPLAAQESKPFEFVSDVPARSGSSEFRVYLDGVLYKTYPIGGKDKGNGGGSALDTTDSGAEQKHFVVPATSSFERNSPPPPAPPRQRLQPLAPPEAPPSAPASQAQPPAPAESPARGPSAEERTMKDLDQ